VGMTGSGYVDAGCGFENLQNAAYSIRLDFAGQCKSSLRREYMWGFGGMSVDNAGVAQILWNDTGRLARLNMDLKETYAYFMKLSANGVTQPLAFPVIASRVGRVYLGGNLNGSLNVGTVDVPRMVESDAAGDAFVVAYDEMAGFQLRWLTPLGGEGTQSITGSTRQIIDGVEKMYTVGTFDTTLSVEGVPSVVSSGGTDLFVAKMNGDDGKVEQLHTFGDAADQSASAMSFDILTRSVLVAGVFQNDLQMGSTTLKNVDPADHLYLATFDADLAVQKVITFPAKGRQSVKSLVVAQNGALYMLGTLSKGEVDFGCAEGPLKNPDDLERPFVVRLSN